MAKDLAGSFPALCQAAILLTGPEAAIGEVSALRLLGVDLPGNLDREECVHVTVPRSRSSPRRPRLVAHHSNRPVPTLARDHPPGPPLGVMRPQEAWVQAAARLGIRSLVAVGDALLRRRDPWCRPQDLAGAVAAAARCRGSPRLRAALHRIRPDTDSIPETFLRLLVVDVGFAEPLVDHPVLDATGRIVAIPDLSYPAARVAIEYEGDHHRVDRATWQRDVHRRRELEERGWRIVSVTAQDLRRPDRLRAALTAALTAALGSAAA